ncbi:MAG: DUF3108 domain-containing protein [Bacteroidales bacterium]|nr:DUF3108 domain-containing protein [Bacteroidales bacterium]
MFSTTIKRISILVILAFTIITNSTTAQKMPFSKGERLKYNIYYQWGIIWKKAAEATLTAQETTFHSDKALYLRLAARTTSFFDNFLEVRDTLLSLTTPDLQPRYYAKITNEGKYHGKDDLTYSYNNGKISTRSRTFRDKQLRSDSTMTHDSTPIYDMMSLFYYIRTLDVPNMKKNQVIPLVIISGDKPYNIKVIYNGEASMSTPDDKEYQTYKLTIVLENKSGKKSKKEQMNLWLSKDEQRLPLQLSAKLPLGTMKAFFQGIE